MDKIQVEVTFGRKGVKEILVNGNSMDNLQPLRGKTVSEYFDPIPGKDSWRGLIEEIRNFLQDPDAPLAFSVYGGSEDMREFEERLKERGFPCGDEVNQTELADVKFHSAKLEESQEHWQKAISLYQEAADMGHSGAEYALGRLYASGQGVERDSAKATEWYRRAAEHGHADAQYSLGERYANGEGVERDGAEAAKWYRKAAQHGHADAQYGLGECYANGEGVERDSAEAAKWYRQAAEQGHANAQFMFGECCRKGEGVERNSAEAAKWYRQAAEQGHANAQYMLGERYYSGDGVNEDCEEAVKWYRMAAERGHADAQYMLGECCYSGDGVKRDKAEAVKWYRMAAEQGHADAQYSLGNCLRTGQGAEKNPAEAEEWYNKAAAQGHQDAVRRFQNEQRRQNMEREEQALEEERQRVQNQMDEQAQSECRAEEAARRAEQAERVNQRVQEIASQYGPVAGAVVRQLIAHGMEDWPNVLRNPEDANPKLRSALWVDKKERILFAYTTPERDDRGFLLTDKRVACNLKEWVNFQWTDFSYYAGEDARVERDRDREKDCVYVCKGLTKARWVASSLPDEADRVFAFWQSLYETAVKLQDEGISYGKLVYTDKSPEAIKEDFKKLLLERGLMDWKEAITEGRLEKLKGINLRVLTGEMVLFAHDNVHNRNPKSRDYGFIVTERNIYYEADWGKKGRMSWFDLASYYGTRIIKNDRDNHSLYLGGMDSPKLLCSHVGETEERKQTLLSFWRALHKDLRDIYRKP